MALGVVAVEFDIYLDLVASMRDRRRLGLGFVSSSCFIPIPPYHQSLRTHNIYEK